MQNSTQIGALAPEVDDQQLSPELRARNLLQAARRRIEADIAAETSPRQLADVPFSDWASI